MHQLKNNRAKPQRLFAAFALSAAALLSAAQANAEEITGSARVVDGDTLNIQGQSIRLDGIDAFEKRQSCDFYGQSWRCGEAATEALRLIIGDAPVTCQSSGLDRYRRHLAICFVGQNDINAQMVQQGWALAYRRYSLRYIVQEQEAQAVQAGAWAGTFETPWDWRRQQRQPKTPQQ